MGIADRSYMQESSRANGASFAPSLRSGRGLSVTAWLIIICVGVFVIDDFLPVQWESQGVQWVQGISFANAQEEFALLQKLKPGDLRVDLPAGRRVVPGTMGARLLTDAAGQPVAREIFRATPYLNALLHFSTSRALVHQAPDGSLRGFEFWRFIGFQFLHGGIWHLAFNMIGLWMFGPIVERTLGAKRYLAFYLLCGICGALMYLLLNAAGSQVIAIFGPSSSKWMPFLLFNDPSTPLVGASAGVFGILMAGAFLVPHAKVYVYGVLPMRLDTLAYALVGVALLSVFFRWSNAGGEAAHIGGAIAGWYFIRHPQHLHGFFNFLGRADPTSQSRKARSKAARDPKAERVEIDRILEKVARKGVQSLTAEEQATLRRASGRD